MDSEVKKCLNNFVVYTKTRIRKDHFDTFLRESLWKKYIVEKEIKEFKSAYISVIDVHINSALILTMVWGRNQQI